MDALELDDEADSCAPELDDAADNFKTAVRICFIASDITDLIFTVDC